MGKYIKYEIKGTYKVILGILAIVLIATTVLYNYTAKKEFSIIIALASMLIFGTFLSAFLYIVGSFRKELYEDRGYLTFTLPLTGNQILGAKLIVAFMWFFLLGSITVSYNIFMLAKTSGEMINFKELLSLINGSEIISFAIMILISGISTLILIYFSMALGRVTLKNKKIGGMWFIIFLVLSTIIAWIQMKIVTISPYYINLKDWSIVNSNISSLFQIEMGSSSLMFSTGEYSYVNILGFVTNIIAGIILFLGTGHIIENKIDL
ncbi:MAG: hypothetical protein KZY61_09655 [Clostridiaceae bacterium]|nr:hypothetical protein [Clostridiaceae bacterium]MBW4860311.1 hypothetical protein [Clostridiaceae bacterium]MBW4868898.1 hypothetical protein [Clostridiaceae bacterium]